ncbi:kvs-3 [Pristionchus pacificus]|uniref:Kvs-3 n=1 Tax=Pristionchus pacificus TaxID=54126 RepID=A0A2A6C893_PRIPA|nr:kvs-3 [Pristionchus pacificus]|eukprot:PDM74273.1 kvs-3 [Pristionchus pacificus]
MHDIESPLIAHENCNGSTLSASSPYLLQSTALELPGVSEPSTAEVSPSFPSIHASSNGGISKKQAILVVNVGGRRAKLPIEKIFAQNANTRLSVFASKSHVERLTDCDAYFDDTGEYYFERSPIIFECVIDFYLMGKLHRPFDVCPIRLRYELDFWRIPTARMAPCCAIDENNNGHGRGKEHENGFIESSYPPSAFERVRYGPFRLKAWGFLENPRSSSGAKIFSIVSALFVLLSLSGLILSSMPELQEANGEPIQLLIYAEMICMIWFTIEYMARFVVNPNKWKFTKSPLNIIDLCTILPFLIEEFLPMKWMKEFRGAMLVIRVMRLARVARIFKLARYSTGLRAFGETMRKSAAELSMLGMFLVTGIMLFSTAIYFFERDEPNSKFYSIPASCWWCVITMTTVGYGDLVPVTTGGKVVAAVASVCGIIVLAFPISMIIDKFAESTGRRRHTPDDETSGD